jgi:UDP-glucose 4-epimerase
MEDKEITIFGEGKMKRAFSYVDDVVEVFIEGMTDKYKNQTVNVGSSMDIEVATLLSIIEKVSGKKAKVNHKPARPQEIWNFLASHRKMNHLVNYNETPLEIGLAKTWRFLNLPAIIEEDNEINTN